jgi:uncharacterized protein (TIGR02246 family)
MPKTAAIAQGQVRDYSAELTEQEIRECLEQWTEAVGEGSPESVTALYAPDAYLLATFDPHPLQTPRAREIYFKNFTARKNLRATIEECEIRVLGDAAAAANGLYTFRYVEKDGSRVAVEARFGFVYARRPDGQWRIVSHHSSQTPTRPIQITRSAA